MVGLINKPNLRSLVYWLYLWLLTRFAFAILKTYHSSNSKKSPVKKRLESFPEPELMKPDMAMPFSAGSIELSHDEHGSALAPCKTE